MNDNFGVPIILQDSVGLRDLTDALKQSLSTALPTNITDEQDRMKKLKELELQSKQTANRYAMLIGVGVLSVGILWYLSK